MLYDVSCYALINGEPGDTPICHDTVGMPKLTHYGYDGGTNYVRANKIYARELMRKAKARMRLTGVRGKVRRYTSGMEFYPYQHQMVMVIDAKIDHASECFAASPAKPT